MSDLRVYTHHDVFPLINKRPGEVKSGERIGLLSSPDQGIHALQRRPEHFVLLGIPEDIGVRANGGIGGAQTAWPAFLKSFLNIQANAFFKAETIFLLGAFEFDSWMTAGAEEDARTLREQCARTDDLVFPVIEAIVSAGKIPIIIGGGHNNAFPVIKGGSNALNRMIHTINLDAHGDYRSLEGRHSGNGFRYAKSEKFLKRYSMLGLHEAYNNQDMITEVLRDDDLSAIWWEDIFVREKLSWTAAVQQALSFVSREPFGVELDLDCIENVLSSAVTPVGITPAQAMSYLYACGKQENACYLHLPEGVVLREDGQSQPLTGKLLSYLVQAFLKGKWDAKENGL